MGKIAERFKKIDISVRDPRSDDFPEDSALWLQLLQLAREEGEYLYGHLLFFRLMGTRILEGKNGYILRPIYRPQGWKSEAQYEEAKKRTIIQEGWIEKIKEILGRLKEWE
jgi:hypothetical protein